MRTQMLLASSAIARATDDATASASAPVVPTVETPAVASKPARKPSAKRAAGKPAVVNAKPSTGKAPKPVAVKPDARAMLTQADRDAARRFYDGQSLAVHSTTPRKRVDYAARVLQPVQCATSPSVRDESGLALILSRADKLGVFDPCAGSGLDLGIVSRLASLALVSFEPRTDAFALTPAGLSRARAVVKRFKAA